VVDKAAGLRHLMCRPFMQPNNGHFRSTICRIVETCKCKTGFALCDHSLRLDRLDNVFTPIVLLFVCTTSQAVVVDGDCVERVLFRLLEHTQMAELATYLDAFPSTDPRSIV
jgi:hypothetical protein